MFRKGTVHPGGVQPSMNSCKGVNHHRPSGTLLRPAHGHDHRRRRTLSTESVSAQTLHLANVRAPNPDSLASREEPTPASRSANPPESPELFKTKSGIDITHRVTELLWLACELGYLTIEMVHQAFSGEDLTPEDLSAIRLMLGQAGVDLFDAGECSPTRSAAQRASAKPVQLKTQNASVQHSLERIEEAHPRPDDPEFSLLGTMREADQEMRRILCRFGFAAQEHIARAERLLGHPSEESFENLVQSREITSRRQYAKTLPELINQVRALDQKAAAAHRRWRQTPGQPQGEEYRTEFRKFENRLQQTLPKFCYRAEAVQEMTTIAQNIAVKFQCSLRVLQQAQRRHDSVSQLPLVDVERQTIEGMEEFVRMPCEVFLRNCTQLRTAETKFQQARCELIRGHLTLVLSLAPACSNRGLTLPQLIREGIFGLIRAVEKFGYRSEWKFSSYAACWIRQNIRSALAARPTAGPGHSLSATSAGRRRPGD